jgi:hypothetical protein
VVGVGLAVGGVVGSAHAISQQISVPFRQFHAPQQQPQVVPEGQSFSSGLHSSPAVGIGVGVGRRTQLQVVHPATDWHTLSYSGRHWNGGSGGQVGVGAGVDSWVGAEQGIAQQGRYGGMHTQVPQQQEHSFPAGQSSADGLHSLTGGAGVGMAEGVSVSATAVVAAGSQSHPETRSTIAGDLPRGRIMATSYRLHSRIRALRLRAVSTARCRRFSGDR